MSDEEEATASSPEEDFSASEDEWQPVKEMRGGESSDDDDSDFENVSQEGVAGSGVLGNSATRKKEPKGRSAIKQHAVRKVKKPATQSLRAKLYKQYKPPPKTSTARADSNSPSASTSRAPQTTKASKNLKKPNEGSDNDDDDDDENNNSSSESSGDDYLVNPAELDLQSSFFDVKTAQSGAVQTSAAAPPPVPHFDCNAGMKLSDSGSEDNNETSGEEQSNEKAFDFRNLLEKANSLERVKECMAKRAAAQATETTNNTTAAVMDVESLLALGENQNQNAIGAAELPQPTAGDTQQLRQKLRQTKSTRQKRHNRTSATHAARGVDSEDSDWEEVADDNLSHSEDGHSTLQDSLTRTESLEIHVELPNRQRSRQDRKQQDLEAMLKRKLNRDIKERQLLLHKTSLLCCFARGYFYNRLLNDAALMQQALLLLPSQNSYPTERGTELKYLQSLVTWFKTVIKLKSENLYDPSKKIRSKERITQKLAQQLQKKQARCKQDMIFLFVILLRGMGLQCRLVVNMQPLPLRPPQSELCVIKLKKDEGAEGDKKSASITELKEEVDEDESSIKKIKKVKEVKTAAPKLEATKSKKTVADKKETQSLNKSKEKQESKTSTRSKPSNTSKDKSKEGEMLNKSKESKSLNKKIETETLDKSQDSKAFNKSKDSHMLNKSQESKSKKSQALNVSKEEQELPKSSKDETKAKRTRSAQKDTKVKEPLVEKKILQKSEESKTLPVNTEELKHETKAIGKCNIKDDKNANKEIKTATKTKAKEQLNKASCSKSNKEQIEEKQALKTEEDIDIEMKELEHIKNDIEQEECAQEKRQKFAESRSKTEIQDHGLENQVEPVDFETLAKSKPTLSKLKRNTVSKEVDSKKPKLNEKIKAPKSSVMQKPIIEIGSPVLPKIVVRKDSANPQQAEQPQPSGSSSNMQTLNAREMRSRSKSPKSYISTGFLQTKVFKEKISNNCEELLKPPNTQQQQQRATSRSPNEKVKINTKFLRDTKTETATTSAATDGIVRRVLRTRQPKSTEPKLPQLDGADDDIDLTLDDVPLKKRPQLKKLQKSRSKEQQDSDEDFEPSPTKGVRKAPALPKAVARLRKDRRVLSTDDDEPESKNKKRAANAADMWVEVWSHVEEEWICVDLFSGKLHAVEALRKSASPSLAYLYAFQNDLSIKDVTARYCPHWTTTMRKARVDKAWLDVAITSYLGRRNKRDILEDQALRRIHEQKPMPTSISDYKDHPLYALERHLLKFQALYPPQAPTLGFVRGEPVYARECVHTLHSRDIWLKQARTVKLGEQPYKIVKARPKWDRINQTVIKDQPLEIFGYWQTQDYDPPTAENGMVPRNAYGNVELFKACMLPKKTAHLRLAGLNRVCKKLGIDCANAVIGFDFHQGACHPTYDGFVVCEEFVDQVTAAWYADQDEQERKEQQKYEARVYGNWKKLIRGLLIRERLKRKYNF